MSLKMLTPELEAAYGKLGIRTKKVDGGVAGDRVLLCLDGGGIRGILTIQLLKKLEELAGMPCHAFCDLVAGTSTGAIIAGLVAYGQTAAEIEEKYETLVTGVFDKRNIISGKYFFIPMYDKKKYRSALEGIVHNTTLQQACQVTNTDLLISAKDVTDNEEIFFTCFNNGVWKGTYKDALLRTVMEATMSAPTYFSPLERFVDGGTTTYNNPSAAAVIEAMEYTGEGKYEPDQLTIFSMGTGISVQSVPPAMAGRPKWPAIKFWLKYVMATASEDANAMQCDMFRSKLLAGIDYRRFQISLDSAAMKMLPDRKITDTGDMQGADSLWKLTNKQLNGIELDDTKKFGLMKDIGAAMVDYIMKDNKFMGDLVAPGTMNDALVTNFGCQKDPVTGMTGMDQIKTNVTSADWINNQQSA